MYLVMCTYAVYFMNDIYLYIYHNSANKINFNYYKCLLYEQLKY